MNMMYYILHINTSNISNSKNFVSLQTNGSCLCLPTCSLSHAPSCTFFFKLVSYFIYSFFEGNALHFFFLFYFILLYNTILVLPYIDMNPPQVYMSSSCTFYKRVPLIKSFKPYMHIYISVSLYLQIYVQICICVWQHTPVFLPGKFHG